LEKESHTIKKINEREEFSIQYILGNQIIYITNLLSFEREHNNASMEAKNKLVFSALQSLESLMWSRLENNVLYLEEKRELNDLLEKKKLTLKDYNIKWFKLLSKRFHYFGLTARQPKTDELLLTDEKIVFLLEELIMLALRSPSQYNKMISLLNDKISFIEKKLLEQKQRSTDLILKQKLMEKLEKEIEGEENELKKEEVELIDGEQSSQSSITSNNSEQSSNSKPTIAGTISQPANSNTTTATTETS